MAEWRSLPNWPTTASRTKAAQCALPLYVTLREILEADNSNVYYFANQRTSVPHLGSSYSTSHDERNIMRFLQTTFRRKGS